MILFASLIKSNKNMSENLRSSDNLPEEEKNNKEILDGDLGKNGEHEIKNNEGNKPTKQDGNEPIPEAKAKCPICKAELGFMGWCHNCRKKM